MRTLLLLAALLLGAATAQAQDYGLYWKYKDYPGSISFVVPGIGIEIGSWFLDDPLERSLLRRVNKVRIMVFENGNSPITDKDMQRFERKAKRRHLEDLVMVRDGKTHVRIMAKDRGAILRKVVVLVRTPEEFALITVRGYLRYDELQRVIDKYNKEKKDSGEDKPVVPDVIKIPTKRI